MTSPTVVIVGPECDRTCQVYHSRQDCRSIKQARSTATVDRDDLGDDWTHCQRCGGTTDLPPKCGKDTYLAAVRAAPEDIWG